MSLFQQARHVMHLPPCLGAGQLGAPSVTTVEVWLQALGAGPSTLDPDNLITILSGTASGAGKYGRSCVGIQ